MIGQVTISAIAEDGVTVTNNQITGITSFSVDIVSRLIKLFQGDTEIDYDASNISSISVSISGGLYNITIS